jgi:hypothetical protein
MSRRVTLNLIHETRGNDAVGDSDDWKAVVADGDNKTRPGLRLLGEQIVTRGQALQLESVPRGKMVGVTNLLRNADQTIRVQCRFHGFLLLDGTCFAKSLLRQSERGRGGA